MTWFGGEPLLDVDRLVALIRYAGAAGIPFIRTCTNGYLFANPAYWNANQVEWTEKWDRIKAGA